MSDTGRLSNQFSGTAVTLLVVPSALPCEQNLALYLANIGNSLCHTTCMAFIAITRLLGVRDTRISDGQDIRSLTVSESSFCYQISAAIYARLQERSASASASNCITSQQRMRLATYRLWYMSANADNRVAGLRTICGKWRREVAWQHAINLARAPQHPR